MAYQPSTPALTWLSDAASNSFRAFCGSEIWNYTETWNSSAIDFTNCFKHTIVTWVPCGFLWLMLPFYVAYLHSQAAQSLSATALNTAKCVISFVPAILSIMEIALYRTQRASDVPTAYIVSSSLSLATMLVAAALTWWCRVRGQVTSAVLWCYWLLWLIGSTISAYSQIKETVSNSELNAAERLQFVITCILFTVCLVQFVLFCFADVPGELRSKYKNVCPEHLASFASFITFHWLSPLIIVGYKKPLQESDLFRLSPRDQIATHVPRFERAWGEAVDTWRKRMATFTEAAADEELDEVTPLLSTQVPPETVQRRGKKSKPKEPSLSLMSVLCRCYGQLVLMSFACKFFNDILKFADPRLQSLLIQFVAADNEYVWKGYLFAFGFMASQLMQTVLYQQLWYLSSLAGMQIRAALVSVIYKKALRMSSEGRKDSTVGEIVNLMAVDAQRIQDAAGYIWVMWSAPLQIGIAMWQLYEVIGVSMFAGFALMVLSMPVNGFVASKMRSLQVLQMKLKDERIKLTSEALSGIKVLKLYAWEPSFEAKISLVRDKEMAVIKKSWNYRAIQIFSWTVLPFLVTVITFGVYVALSDDHIFKPEVAFVALSLFGILSAPLNLLPMMIAYTVMASVSVKRLVKFFKTPDLDERNVQHVPSTTAAVSISNGTFKWQMDFFPALNSINLEVPKHSLTAIVGQVGCGKSSLLSACIGEMYKVSGKVNVDGRVAYVSQQAWIQNTTVRDNILFGREYNEKIYKTIIQACALQPDLDILDKGDLTLIGEKGINLSGGQKQRISMARAIYADADIYLLDDPLSAVDAHVGQHIFREVIGNDGLLAKKTRVLVTHGIHWLPYVDNVIVMVASRVTEKGSYDELLSHNGPFAQFLKTYFITEQPEDVAADVLEVEKKILQRLDSVLTDTLGDHSDSLSSVVDLVERKKTTRQLSTPAADHSSAKHNGPTDGRSKKEEEKSGGMTSATDQETLETGKVNIAVYKSYTKALGLWPSLVTMGLIVLYFVINTFSSVWLSQWTNDAYLMNMSASDQSRREKENMYLGVYAGLGGMLGVVTLLYSLSFAYALVRASGVLHAQLLHGIMRGTMAFFDTKPMGMTLNRFSKDIDTVDNTLGFLIFQVLMNAFNVVCTVVVIAYSTPIFLVVVIPIGVIYYLIQRFFIPTTRQLKRLESVTRTPIYTHFTETVNGCSVIRAFGYEDRFINTCKDNVEKNMLISFLGFAANRWLAIRLEILGALVVFGAAVFAVMSKEYELRTSASLVGLAITYALNVTYSLNFLIRGNSDLEANIVSVERIKEYSEVPREAEWAPSTSTLPDSWPQRGEVEFKGYSTRYRPELSLVLNGISLLVKAGEKIGVVGRTGAGKSSLTLALFRLIESAGGSIVIDGIDVAHIGLHQLRRKLTILPQDPVLFSGTLRFNLDPFDEYSDDQVWAALEQAHLIEFAKSQPSGLLHQCGEGGQNLSIGQRQLMCLARSLLRKTKVLVLDEATAAVDLKTDDLIQKTIRSAFADCTVFTIAHRLNTILDNDRILVLDKGTVLEFDSPTALLQNSNSMFYKMAQSAGLV